MRCRSPARVLAVPLLTGVVLRWRFSQTMSGGECHGMPSSLHGLIPSVTRLASGGALATNAIDSGRPSPRRAALSVYLHEARRAGEEADAGNSHLLVVLVRVLVPERGLVLAGRALSHHGSLLLPYNPLYPACGGMTSTCQDVRAWQLSSPSSIAVSTLHSGTAPIETHCRRILFPCLCAGARTCSKLSLTRSLSRPCVKCRQGHASYSCSIGFGPWPARRRRVGCPNSCSRCVRTLSEDVGSFFTKCQEWGT